VGEVLKLPIEVLKRDMEMLAPKIGPALDDLISGVYVEERTPQGMRRVYQRPPNITAIIEVVNRIMGKVAERIEVKEEYTERRETLTLIAADPRLLHMARELAFGLRPISGDQSGNAGAALHAGDVDTGASPPAD